MFLAKLFFRLSGLLVILTVFSIPLYFGLYPSSYNLFELAKFSLFKVLGACLAISVSWWLITDASARAKAWAWRAYYFSWLLPPFLFGAYLTFSAWLSGNFSLVFFGSYDRQDGVLNFWILLVWFFFVLLYLSLREDKKFLLRRVAPAASLSALFVSSYGIAQFFGFDIIYWQESPLLARIFSSFGQPNFLAAFLLFSLPLSAYLAYSRRGGARILAGASLVFQVAALLFTSSRAAIIGLVVGLALLAWNRRKRLSPGLSKNGLAIAASLAALILFAFMAINPGRFSWEMLRQGSAKARLDFLEAGTFSLMQRPLFGYGLAGIGNALFPYYDVDWGASEEINTAPDRTHNILLDFSLSFGMVGWGFFIFWFWRWRCLYGRPEHDASEAIVLFALASYGISLLFGFLTVVNFIFLWLFAACLIADRSPRAGTWQEKAKPTSSLPWAGVFVLAVCALVFELRVWRADVSMNRVYSMASREDFIAADQEYANLRSLPTYPTFAQKYRFLYLELSIDRLGKKGQPGDIHQLESLIWELPENDFNSTLLKAVASGKLGRDEEARRLFRLAQDFSSHLPLAYYHYGQYLATIGQGKEAAMQFYLAELNSPDLNRAVFAGNHRQECESFLAKVYLALGEVYLRQEVLETAGNYFERSFSLNPAEPKAIKGMADSYFLAGNLDRAAEYIRWGQSRFPDDPAWAAALQAIQDIR